MSGRTFDAPRTVRAEELPAVLGLINAVFSPTNEGDMGRRYPVLFARENLENCLAMWEEGDTAERGRDALVTHGQDARATIVCRTPVAHAACLVRDAVVGGATIRVGMVGAVCTREDARGFGLASMLLDELERRMIGQGVDVVMISGARGLYLRRGARPVSRQFRYRITRAAAAGLADEEMLVKPAGPRDLETLAALYETNPVRFVRPRADWERWLACARCENYPAQPMIGSVGGRPVAYVVHRHANTRWEPVSLLGEWAGDPEYVLRVVAAAAEVAGRDYVDAVLDEVSEAELVGALEQAWVGGERAEDTARMAVPRVSAQSAIARERTEYGRTIKVLRPIECFEKLRGMLGESMRGVRVVEEEAGVRLGLGGESVVMDEGELAWVLFGEPEQGSLLKSVEVPERLREALDGRTPCPLPRYGYDYT